MKYSKQKHNKSAYRSGLEVDISDQIIGAGQTLRYELMKLRYVKPVTHHTYTPDFELDNGIIIESKGFFSVEDRKKHKLIQKQQPELDLRFVFSNSRGKLFKGSKTTYANWCEKNNFKYADKLIPEEWLNE